MGYTIAILSSLIVGAIMGVVVEARYGKNKFVNMVATEGEQLLNVVEPVKAAPAVTQMAPAEVQAHLATAPVSAKPVIHFATPVVANQGGKTT